MMLAAEFARNSTARQTDFSFSQEERGEFWMAERRGEGRAHNEGGEAKSGRKRRVKGAMMAQVRLHSIWSVSFKRLTATALGTVRSQRPQTPRRRSRTHS